MTLAPPQATSISQPLCQLRLLLCACLLCAQTLCQSLSIHDAGLQAAEQRDVCQAGMARTSLHMGDAKQGRALALESNSPQLCKECAQILESQDKQQVLIDAHPDPAVNSSIVAMLKHQKCCYGGPQQPC